MSTRTALRPYPVINAVSMAASITSSVTVLQSLSDFSYEVTWSGTTPVGTISMQVSNSYALAPDGSTATAGTWTSVPLEVNDASVATTVAVSGNTGTIYIDVSKHAGYAVRLIYTRASGTGTMTAVIKGGVA